MKGQNAAGEESGEDDDGQGTYPDRVSLGNQVAKVVRTLKNVGESPAREYGVVLHRDHVFPGQAFNRVEWHTQAEGTTRPALVFHSLLDLDGEALDLLVEGGKGNAELLRRIRLVPLAALQLIDDDAPLDVFQNVE